MNKGSPSTKALFFMLVTALVLAGSSISILPISGVTDKAFSLVQMFAPAAGAFLGIFGIAAIALAEAIRYVLTGSFEFSSAVTLLTMSAAAAFFALKGRKSLVAIPVACMLLFWMHPNGQQAWFYALYWLIPIAASIFYSDRLVAKSLGATFTAHAIGSVAYLYAFNLAPEVWIALIPVVAIERLLFSSGIITFYTAMNTVLGKLEDIVPQGFVDVDPRYVASREFFRLRA